MGGPDKIPVAVDPPVQISRRVQPGKRQEIVDEMRLIEISATTGDIGPVHRFLRMNAPQDFLETSNAAKEFWCQADFAPELFDELLVTHSQTMGNGGNALDVRLAHELADGPCDAPVPARLGTGDGHPLQKHFLEQFKLSLRPWRLQEPLPPLPNACSPEGVHLDDLPANFTRGASQEIWPRPQV